MANNELTRSFVRGVMDKDTDERLLEDGKYRDSLNTIGGASSNSNVGSRQHVLGNERMSDLATLTGRTVSNSRCIGALAVEEKGLVYWLVASDFFDGIFEYNVSTGTAEVVLQSNKVSASTPSKLNFSQSYVAHSINYISGLLYWVDDYNPPFKINITRAKSYAVDDSRIDDDLKVIVRPPLNAPYIVMSNDGTQSNNMSEKFLYFATRNKYVDNEYSALSPFSPAAFVPGDYEFDPQKGYNGGMVNINNKVDITFQTGSEFVTEVQLVMLDSTSKNVFIIESFNKQELNIPDNFSYTFDGFSNNKTYSVLPSDQIGRLFDNVPIKSGAQDIVGNRLVYGDYVQFYDIVDETKTDIPIDFSVSYVNDLATPTQENPLPTFRSDRDAEIGIIYTDEYGRMSTVLTSPTNTVYVKPEDSSKANSLLVQIQNTAPEWASYWRLSIKQSKMNYYNLFPILFYKDGNYRYFLLNESDRDKLAVGEYVIFKAGPTGVTNSNKQYKVLEIELKEAGFISGGVSEIAGLYFKIKVDSASEFSPNSLFNYSSTGEGCNTTEDGLLNNGETTISPVTGSFQVAENPIFYGDGNGAALTVSNNNAYSGQYDLRYTIEIESATTFRYTTNLDGTGPYIESGVSIATGTDIPIKFPGPGATAFTIRFSTTTGFVVGDKWKVSCRGVVLGSNAWNNYFGGIGLSQMNGSPASLVGGYAIVPGIGWSPTTPNETDTPINVGAIITLNIVQDRYNPNAQAGAQQFPPSDRNYKNIEEWFVESGAYLLFDQIDLNGNNVGSTRISFRRGASYQNIAGFSPGADLTNTVNQGGSVTSTTLAYPVRMFIAGCGIDDGPNNQNHIIVTFSIQQQNNSNIVETVPKPNDIDIYHELSRTYRIEDGYHMVNWAYEDFIFYQSSGPYNGYTALTQLTPGEPHYFEVGETVIVNTSNVAIDGTWEVVEIPNPFTVVIDLLFPGAGPVTPGTIAHNAIDTDQDAFPNVAKVIINNPNNKNSNFNAWSFGNGLESNRIKDDFNQSVLEYSPRVTSVIEDYKQVRNENALTNSGVFQENTSVNRLNEFNLSTTNFKYLDKSFGAVQKIYARDTDLAVFQEHKVSILLYQKELLVNSDGTGNIASADKIFGTQIALPYEVGISKNPESFAVYGPDIFFTDAYRGSVLMLTGNQIEEINKFGMKNYFREMFASGANTQKLGAFDPYSKTYVLASNNISSVPCNLSIVPSSITVTGPAKTNINLFEITSDSSWTIAAVNTGSGTGWLTGFSTSGTGSKKIKGSLTINNTGLNRSLILRITYCGGLTVDFTLTQGRGDRQIITSIVFNNVNEHDIKAKL
jgi:hypothetical protein